MADRLLTKEVATEMFPGARLIDVRDSPETLETLVILGYSAQLQQAQPLDKALARVVHKGEERIRQAERDGALRALDEYRLRMRGEPKCQRVNDEAMIAAASVLADLRARITRGEFP